jgi:RecJ-like exonuclease
MPDVYSCPECKGKGAVAPDYLPCWACGGGGEIELLTLSADYLRHWLAIWREVHKGSRSPENNRKLLATRTRAELRRILEAK